MIMFYIMEIYVVPLSTVDTADGKFEWLLLGSKMLSVVVTEHGTIGCNELMLR